MMEIQRVEMDVTVNAKQSQNQHVEMIVSMMEKSVMMETYLVEMDVVHLVKLKCVEMEV